MKLISIPAAVSLTEWSVRTLWRRVSDGSIKRQDKAGTGMVDLESILPHACIPLSAEDIDLILAADAGDSSAQTDLAILFVEHQKFKSALYWVGLATELEYPEAMHFMGRSYLAGDIGLPKDENLGLMWIAKAAAHGHVVAQGQMQAMRDKFIAKEATQVSVD